MKHHRHHNGYVTRDGWGVSFDSTLGQPGGFLRVSKLRDLPNSFGGIGKSQYGDADGKWFASSEEAWEYAYEYGYLQEFVHPWCPMCRELHMHSTHRWDSTKQKWVAIETRSGWCAEHRKFCM